MLQKSISLLVKWVLAQAHEHTSTVMMTVRCIMEAWNKRNPLTEHYFEETTRPLTCLNLFYHAFQSRNWKVENEKQKIEMENGCPPSASVGVELGYACPHSTRVDASSVDVNSQDNA